jgi:GNAT superfamily N-acetyltransferase
LVARPQVSGHPLDGEMSKVGNAQIEFREAGDLPEQQVLRLYSECRWSAAQRLPELLAGLSGSHVVVSAWHADSLVGLGNAISDGALVVYYPHLLVRPAYQRSGIGRQIMQRLQLHYRGFHQQVLLAVLDAAPFYKALGFAPARSVTPLWVYEDTDHNAGSLAV